MSKNKGFTLVEMVVAMLLSGLILLAVFNIVALISDNIADSQVESSLHSICISVIEEQKHALEETHVLSSDRIQTTGEIGSVYYTLVYYAEPLDYSGAYKLNLNLRSADGYALDKEVLLYDQV